MFVFGFVVMVVAAVFFLVMALRYDGEADTRRHGPMFFYLVFFVTSISAMTYYSMWTETSVLHVEQEGDDEDKRTIFPARYIDWIVTTPLMLATVSLLGNAPTSSLVAMIGSDLLFFSSLYIGAVQTAGHKWFWWGVGVFFFIMLVYFMLVELSKVDTGRVKEYDADTLRMLTYFFIICWAFFPLLWLFGQEGTAASSLPVQAAFTTLADLTAKIAFGLIVVFRSQPDYTEYVPERDPQRVVTSSAFVAPELGGVGMAGLHSRKGAKRSGAEEEEQQQRRRRCSVG
nr:protein 110 [synthetic construct]